MKPRIYTYKITFPYQKWWYWGVHKEMNYGEAYDGSSVTHSDKWKNFEFEKQILEYFDDWDVARSVEKRLIGPDLNNPLCLNENSGGGFSLDVSSKGGKNGSREDKVRSGKIGSREDKVKAGKIGGKNQSREDKARGGKNQSREDKARGGKTTNSQKWKCLVTGYISTSAGLSNYQRARGIDTNQRIRIND